MTGRHGLLAGMLAGGVARPVRARNARPRGRAPRPPGRGRPRARALRTDVCRRARIPFRPSPERHAGTSEPLSLWRAMP